ncbi:MAG: acyl-phosphate glycerol 3-phosphate acyltransferase [Candidatus Meridianibacter frigidus]|nr:MAG: acyl-phosphate glycerol 3-phosphate acyltransferase [Candidatus Eremiobacteraeota bacterium]
MILIAACLVAFFFGSIPFGYLIGRVFYGIDIRTQGSGNIGAANALRTMGKTGAAAVLALDALKGFLPVFFSRMFFSDPAIHAATASAAVLGHCFSPWLAGRGGKGVATSVGAIFALSWAAGIVSAGGWVAGAGATAFSSVGSLLANALAPFTLWYFTRRPAYVAYGVFAAVLIVYTHRENIGRLLHGREHTLPLLRPWRKRNEGNPDRASY